MKQTLGNMRNMKLTINKQIKELFLQASISICGEEFLFGQFPTQETASFFAYSHTHRLQASVSLWQAALGVSRFGRAHRHFP